MEYLADFVVSRPTGDPVLVVEAKAKRHTNETWAITMRKNLLSHRVIRKSQFFLLALPDHFYLWHQDPTNLQIDAPPQYEIDAKPILIQYYENAGVRSEDIRGEVFESVIGSWLNDLLDTDRVKRRRASEQSWLEESGLLDEIADGALQREVKG